MVERLDMCPIKDCRLYSGHSGSCVYMVNDARRRFGLPEHKDNDPVNHPAHYTQYKGLEIIDLTEQLNFNRGSVVKYIARAGYKDPKTEIQDLEKARWYIEREIKRVRNNNVEEAYKEASEEGEGES